MGAFELKTIVNSLFTIKKRLTPAAGRSGFLIALGVAELAALAAAVAAPRPPPLEALRWAPRQSQLRRAEVAAMVTTRPPECLAPPADPSEAWSVEVGRAAFRDPLIFGGRAGRAGISCESCHPNGRADPDFKLPGISAEPGTADVTSFLGPPGGGHNDPPQPIPDLAGPKSAMKIPQARSSLALETFIRALVTREFDGPPPPPAVTQGLAAYVRALSPGACAAVRETVGVEQDVADSRRAVLSALGALGRRDPATAVVMLDAARADLGGIAQHYPGARLAADRQGVARAERDLAGLAGAAGAGAGDAPPRLSAWVARAEGWAAPLRRDESRSLYDRRTLALTAFARNAP